MSWRRVLWLVVGAAWLAWLGVTVTKRIGAIRGRFPEASAPRAERARLESGNPPFQDFLERFGRALPADSTALLLVRDPSRQVMYHSYRACFELYPTRVRAFPVEFTPPPGKRFTLRVDEALLGLVRGERIARAGFFAQQDPAASRFFLVAEAPGGQLAFTASAFVDGEAGVPRVPLPARPWAWALGVAALLAAGWLANDATGLARPFGRDWAARAGLAWFTGAGIAALGFFALSFARVPWGFPAAAGLAAAVAAGSLTLSRVRPKPPTAPGEPFQGRAPSVRSAQRAGLPWDERAGVALTVLAAAVAVAQSLFPQNAWWNWDGWAIYDFKARVCFAARGVPLAFLMDPLYKFANQAYPPGFQLVQAYLGYWAGGIGTPWLRLGSTLYYLALLGVFSHLVADLGARRHRWMLTALLAHVPHVVTQASDGYMDLLMSAAMTAVLAVLAKAARGEAPLWTVAWLCGVAAFMKDEGMSFGAFALVVLLLVIWSRRATFAQYGAAVAVLALTAGPWRVFTRLHDIRLKDWKFSLDYLFDNLPTTAPKMFKAAALEFFADGPTMANIAGPWNSFSLVAWWGHLSASWLLLWFAAVLGLVIGWKAFRAAPFRELGLLLLMQQGVHGVFYLMTILDLDFHLVTSVYRRALQAAPGFLALAAAAWLKAMAPPAPPSPLPPGRPKR